MMPAKRTRQVSLARSHASSWTSAITLPEQYTALEQYFSPPDLHLILFCSLENCFMRGLHGVGFTWEQPYEKSTVLLLLLVRARGQMRHSLEVFERSMDSIITPRRSGASWGPLSFSTRSLLSACRSSAEICRD